MDPCETCGKLEQPHDPCDCPNAGEVEDTPLDNYYDDGEALASAGWGTDEDYGCLGDEM